MEKGWKSTEWLLTQFNSEPDSWTMWWLNLSQHTLLELHLLDWSHSI